MAKKIAIKIDVDTKRGYDEGVPRMKAGCPFK